MDFQYNAPGYRSSYHPTVSSNPNPLGYVSGVLSGRNHVSADFNRFFPGIKNPFGNGQPGIRSDNNPRMQTHPTNPTVNADIIEVGYYTNGKADEHAQSVMDVYIKHNPQGQNHAHYVGVGTKDPDQVDSSNAAAPITNTQELNAFIDSASSDALNLMSDKINQSLDKTAFQALNDSFEVLDDSLKILNGSLGYSRDEIYEDVLRTLKEKPHLAPTAGLTARDISSLKQTSDGRLVIPTKVSDAIVQYVDQRMDRPGSAYQQSLSKYQQATQNAADHGVTVVVAAGNEHALNRVFRAHKLGGDTNFLAQSDHVISVAATEGNGTKAHVASFSSNGDGSHNPTVAADGVDVPTPFGLQDGTSFAAPQVTALIARLEQENPHLNFQRIKKILQGSATPIDSDSTLATGAGVINPDLAIRCSQAMKQFDQLEQLG